MKKFVFIIFISIFAIVGCTVQEKKMVESVEKNSVAEVESVEKPYSNPAVFYGSDFMSFMQSLRKIGNYDMMLQFTSSESIKKYGKQKVKQYYKKKFTNMSKLKLQSVTCNSDGTKTLNYVNTSVATKSAASVIVVVENDTCKLVLPTDLKEKILN